MDRGLNGKKQKNRRKNDGKMRSDCRGDYCARNKSRGKREALLFLVRHDLCLALHPDRNWSLDRLICAIEGDLFTGM